MENLEWVKHPDMELDHPVLAYRFAVMKGAKGREGRSLSVYTAAPEYIYWEKIKPSPEQEVHLNNTEGGLTAVRFVPWNDMRRVMEGPTTNWERPLSKDIPSDCVVLSSGEVVKRVAHSA